MSFLQVGGIVLSALGIVALAALPFVRISYSQMKKEIYPSRDGQTSWVVESEVISDEQRMPKADAVYQNFLLVHMAAWFLLPLGISLIFFGTK